MAGKLARYSGDSVVAGVCSGIAWVIFTLLGGAGILFYLIFWLLLPSR